MDITREQFLAHPSITKLPEPQRQQLAREFFKEVVRPSLKAVPKAQRAGTLANWTGIDTHQVAQVHSPLEAFGRGFTRQTTRDGTTATVARVATGGALADKSRQNYTTTGGTTDVAEALGRFVADLADPLSLAAGGVAGKLAGKAITSSGAGRAVVDTAARLAATRAAGKAAPKAARAVASRAPNVVNAAGRAPSAAVAREAAARAGERAGRAAAQAASARATAAATRTLHGAAGAAANAPLAAGASVAHQLDQTGQVDAGQLAQDTLFGAVLGGGVGALTARTGAAVAQATRGPRLSPAEEAMASQAELRGLVDEAEAAITRQADEARRVALIQQQADEAASLFAPTEADSAVALRQAEQAALEARATGGPMAPTRPSDVRRVPAAQARAEMAQRLAETHRDISSRAVRDARAVALNQERIANDPFVATMDEAPAIAPARPEPAPSSFEAASQAIFDAVRARAARQASEATPVAPSLQEVITQMGFGRPQRVPPTTILRMNEGLRQDPAARAVVSQARGQAAAMPPGTQAAMLQRVRAEQGKRAEAGNWALNVLQEDQAGSIPGAMHRPDVGHITFDWGDVGTGPPKYKGAKGLAKLIHKRDYQRSLGLIDESGEAVARSIVETLAKGHVVSRSNLGDPRVVIRRGEYEAVLSLKRHGQDETWLVTGYKRIASPENSPPVKPAGGQDPSSPTPADPTLSRANGGAEADPTVAQEGGVLKRFLEDETGSLDLGAMHANLTKVARKFGRDAAGLEAIGEERMAAILRDAEDVARQSALLFRERPEALVEPGSVSAEAFFNFRRSGLSGPEAERMAQRVREVAAERGFSSKQRVTFAEVRKEAEGLGVAVRNLKPVKQGATLDPAVRVAARDRLNELNAQIVALEQELRAGAGIMEPEHFRVLEVQRQQLEHDAKGLLDVLIPTRSQDGRNLAFHAMVAKNSFDTEYWLARAVREAGELPPPVQTRIRQLLADGQQALGAGDEAAAREARIGLALEFARLERKTALQTAATLRKAGLLTSTKTTLRNLGGNLVNQVGETAIELPAAFIDMLMANAPRLVGQQARARTVQVAGLDSIGYGLRKQFTAGLRDAVETLRHGATRDTLAQLEIPSRVNTGNRFVDAYANGVFRLLAGQDAFFKAYALHKSLHAQAKRAGLSLEDAAKNEAIMAEAIADAEFATFTNDTAISKGVAGLKQRGGPELAALVDFAVPFVKTPSAVADRVLEYALVGSLGKAAFAAGRSIRNKAFTAEEQRALAKAFGRSVVGLPLIYMGWKLAKEGILQGDYDPEKKGLADETGRGFGTVRIGDRWVPIGQLSPVGNLLIVGASLFENGTSLASLGAASAQAVANQPFLTGLSDAVEAARSPKEGLARFTSSFAGSFMPSALADVAMAGDGVRRDTRDADFGEAVKKGVMARVPGLRQQVPERLGVFGDPLPETSGPAAFLPIGRQDRSGEPAVAEVVSSGAPPPQAGKQYSIRDGVRVELPPALQRKYRQMVGQALKASIEQWREDPRWKALDQEGKRDAIQKLYAEARESVKPQFNAQEQAALTRLLIQQDPKTAARYGLIAGR